MTITETEHTYVCRDGNDLLAIVYRPDPMPDGPMPVVIDIHGGAWSSGHRKSGRHYDRRLAQAGFCVVSIDFRQGPDFKHPAAPEDILAAIRWTRTVGLKELGVTLSTFGLIGSSSGGHLAMYTALNANGLTEDDDDLRLIDFVIALWPVSNPIARYQYVNARLEEPRDPAQRFHPEQLLAGHEAYFEDASQMASAAIQQILVDGRYSSLPALYIVQPELDQNVPVMMSQTLRGAWMFAGGEAHYKCYAGVGHAFAHVEGPESDECISDMIAWTRQWHDRRTAASR